MQYRGALLLDLDGTLVDSAKDFVHVIQQMQQQQHIPLTSATDIRNTVSDGARALIKLAWQIDEHHIDFQPLLQQMLDHYEQQIGTQAQLFTGFDALFDYLKQHHIAWGIVTNKPWRFTQKLVQQLALSPTNHVVICPEHVSKTKPDAEPLLLAAEKLQLLPTQCLYAGDHLRDIEAAHNAGMTSIACAYGYIAENDDITTWNSDNIINNINELELIIKEFYKL